MIGCFRRKEKVLFFSSFCLLEGHRSKRSPKRIFFDDFLVIILRCFWPFLIEKASSEGKLQIALFATFLLQICHFPITAHPSKSFGELQRASKSFNELQRASKSFKEGKGREDKEREGKEREGKGGEREEKGREGKRREGKGKGKGREASLQGKGNQGICRRLHFNR